MPDLVLPHGLELTTANMEYLNWGSSLDLSETY